MSIYKPIAFLFPGQASQYAGLGKDLHDNFKVARDIFKEATLTLDIDIADLCFNGTESDLSQTANTQPAILTVSIAAWRVFDETFHQKVNIVGMAGHSLGEYSALVAAGAISFEDGLRIVRLRGQAMQEASDEVGPTMMAAIIGLTFEQINNICEEVIEGEIINTANFNSPNQVVISGHKNSIINAGGKVKKLGGKFIPLKVSAPFHCDIMKPVELVLEDNFKTVEFKDPRIPVLKNIDTLVYRGAWEIPRALVFQTTSAVMWDVSVNNLIRMGAREFYIPCPSKVIAGLMRQIDKSIPVYGMDDFKTMRTAFEAIQ